MNIRRGVTRTVLLTKRYAIKVPRIKHFKDSAGKYGTKIEDRIWSFARGILANQSETQWSKYASTAYDKPQVVPVLWSLWGLINIYPRVEIELVSAKLDDLYDELEFKTPADIHVGNIGYYKNSPVWTDYDMNYNDCRRKHA